MLERDRRLGFRIPIEIFLNHYIEDRPYRGLTTNLSDSGIHLCRVRMPRGPGSRVVALELELPGTNEVIWARGEICYDQLDAYTQAAGIRFTAMPRVHARLIRDYCIEARRAHLGSLLERIRQPAA